MHSLGVIYFHIVFSTKERRNYIGYDWQGKLYGYIAGIIKRRGCTPLAIGGISDHIHLLIRARATTSVPDLVREIKKASSKYIKEQLRQSPQFQWQDGYSVFSVSHSAVPNVAHYINTQIEHHLKYTSEEEMRMFFEKCSEPFRR